MASEHFATTAFELKVIGTEVPRRPWAMLNIAVDGDEEVVEAEQATLAGYYDFVVARGIELLEHLCIYCAPTYFIRLLHTYIYYST